MCLKEEQLRQSQRPAVIYIPIVVQKVGRKTMRRLIVSALEDMAWA